MAEKANQYTRELNGLHLRCNSSTPWRLRGGLAQWRLFQGRKRFCLGLGSHRRRVDTVLSFCRSHSVGCLHQWPLDFFLLRVVFSPRRAEFGDTESKTTVTGSLPQLQHFVLTEMQVSVMTRTVEEEFSNTWSASFAEAHSITFTPSSKNARRVQQTLVEQNSAIDQALIP